VEEPDCLFDIEVDPLPPKYSAVSAEPLRMAIPLASISEALVKRYTVGSGVGSGVGINMNVGVVVPPPPQPTRDTKANDRTAALIKKINLFHPPKPNVFPKPNLFQKVR
jgi:hypothetical protein